MLSFSNKFLVFSAGYIVTAEFHSRSGSRNLALQFLDSTLKSIKAFIVFPYARSGRVAIDTKRNELYVIAQLARSAFSKGSTPKLAFAIAVKKTTLTGDVIPGGETLVKAGETELQDSSLSCFYDIARDRLVLQDSLFYVFESNLNQVQFLFFKWLQLAIWDSFSHLNDLQPHRQRSDCPLRYDHPLNSPHAKLQRTNSPLRS